MLKILTDTGVTDSIGQETIKLRLDYLVALTGPSLQTQAIEYRDLASPVTDQPDVLRLPGSFGDAFTAYAQHVGLSWRARSFADDRGLVTATGIIAGRPSGATKTAAKRKPA